MGEKEGARGYLYQAMACVLAAIREDNSICVQFEPDFTEETVDIAFQYRDVGLKAVRVKFSSAPITEPDALDCLLSLAEHTPGAASYRLIMIGDSAKAKEISDSMDKLREGKAGKAAQKLIDQLGESVQDKLSVEVLDDDFCRHEAAFMAELGPLLATQGFCADEAQMQFVIGAICYRFNQFSTNSRFIPARVFIRKLIGLVELYYPDVNTEAGLKLQYYYDHRLYDVGSPIKPNLIRSDLIKQRMCELRGLYREIRDIPLPPKPARLPSLAESSHDDDASCEYAEETQTGIREMAKAILKLDLPDDFFYVGGAKRKDAIRHHTGGWDTPAGFDGTLLELHKFEKLEQFAQGLTYLEGLLRIFVYLDRYDIIPLVLTNTGDCFHKNVRVRVELPKAATLLTQNCFPQPALCVLADLTGEDGLLHRRIKQESDVRVRQYHVSYYPPAHSAYLYIGPQKKEQESKELQADFAAYLDSIFRFEVSDDDDLQRHILEFEFEEIKQGQSIAFPCFLFVQCKKSFTIRYRITSKELSAPLRGRLEYGVE